MIPGRGTILDRPLEPEWMDSAVRIGRACVTTAEARQELDRALRAAPLGDVARTKTVTALVRVWIAPELPARDALLWARERLWEEAGDFRGLHLLALLAVYPFFADVCRLAGRALALEEEVRTPALRAAMRAAWGDRRTVHNAVQRAVKTLRAFGALLGDRGTSISSRGERLPIPPAAGRWAPHALLLARAAESIDERELRSAPELFGIALPPTLGDEYAAIERHREGGGRIVLTLVAPRTVA